MRSTTPRRETAAAVLATTAAIVAAAFGLVGCAPEPEPEPEPLSVTEAGSVYLEAVCPVNDAWDAADLQIDLLRIELARGGDDASGFADAMVAVSRASGAAARELDAAEQSWPDAASEEIAAVRKTLAQDRRQAARVAKLPADEAVAYAWQGGDAIGETALAARRALGLPDDGEAACAQWRAAASESGKSESEASGSAAAPSAEPGTEDSDAAASESEEDGS
ncbi:hypothetical protein MUN77_09210 [Leucobacter allii]|uniref:hypothetical protein n=1 Tax=Leucobacter allii TaxID=2932247 RepID=UPI001FD1175D|nr:hypothetical protein [Leucobacter allii]UOR00356.1 hypothetical protein MUN77_09210 [Leucobacter allii]